MKLNHDDADTREALFGGQGAVRVWDLLGAQTIAPFSAVLGCELDPGGSVGKHVQQRDPEIVVGLEGTGVAEVDDVPHRLDAGCVVPLPHGNTLAIRNESETDPLRYLIIKAHH